MTPAAPARPARPAVVTVAFWLQIAAVAVLFVLVALVVFGSLRYNAQIDEALRRVPDADPTEVAGERSGVVFMALTTGIPALLLAAWLGATALPLRRGSNTARILVFVAAGAQLLLCLVQSCGGLLAIPFMMAAVATDGSGYDPDLDPGLDGDQSKFLDTLAAQGDPGVLVALGGIGLTLVLVLSAAVVVLLLVPDANRWFRPPPPAAWPPPASYGYWPGYPAPAYPPGYPSPAYPPGYPAAGMPFSPGYPVYPDPALYPAHSSTEPVAATPGGAPAGDAARDDAAPGADSPDS